MPFLHMWLADLACPVALVFQPLHTAPWASSQILQLPVNFLSIYALLLSTKSQDLMLATPTLAEVLQSAS